MALFLGAYAIQWALWTDDAKEKAFKQQFVDHASEKLQSKVSVISAKCSGQVRQKMTSTLKKLELQVEREVEKLEENIRELCKEIEKVEKIENKAKTLRKTASWLENELSEFITEFGLEESNI